MQLMIYVKLVNLHLLKFYIIIYTIDNGPGSLKLKFSPPPALDTTCKLGSSRIHIVNQFWVDLEKPRFTISH